MPRRTTYIDPEVLRRHVFYNLETGQFFNLIPTARLPIGYVFSTKYPNSYIKLWIAKRSYSAHRAAWVYMTGEQPIEIDHLNGWKHDNRWVNLANVTHSQNMLNTRRHRPPDHEEP